MHVAINGWFCGSPATGSGQYARKLVEHIAGAAPDLEISLIVRESGVPDIHAAVRQIQLQPTRDGGRLLANLGKLWFEQVAFPRACARLEADVAHVPYWAPPVRSSAPIVVTIHDLIPLVLPRYRGGLLQRLYTALVGAAARGSTLVLTDSQASREDILTRLRHRPDRVRAIPLAADDRYHPEPSPEDAATRAGYNLPDRYVLYLGGFDVRKNLATVLATYRWAGPVVGETCPLIIAGRLPERDTAFTPDPRRLMREEEVDERVVRFSGFVNEADKPALYRGAVAFVFPSFYEGFGLPVLEALACGVPVVGSDTASLPEIVGNGGALLPPNDAEGMAGVLINMVLDAGFRDEVSGRALAQAAKFSWKRTAEETLMSYEDALRYA